MKRQRLRNKESRIKRLLPYAGVCVGGGEVKVGIVGKVGEKGYWMSLHMNYSSRV